MLGLLNLRMSSLIMINMSVGNWLLGRNGFVFGLGCPKLQFLLIKYFVVRHIHYNITSNKLCDSK